MQDLVVTEIPEWKMKAKLARCTMSEGIFGHFWPKIGKSDYLT